MVFDEIYIKTSNIEYYDIQYAAELCSRAIFQRILWIPPYWDCLYIFEYYFSLFIILCDFNHIDVDLKSRSQTSEIKAIPQKFNRIHMVPMFWSSEKNLVGYTVENKNLCTIHRAYGVKLPLLRAVWAGQGSILPLVKWIEFFLGPWLVVCKFIDISNQMAKFRALNKIFLYNMVLYKKICSRFETSPFDSIWLEMSIH